ncbi:MAG: metallophosphoesterase [Gammaproteobacteria bacterium]|nr:metallophosphoesterase [Gammaproteobacteria bacterium]
MNNNPAIKRFEKNLIGTDYVVGDIHGEFVQLVEGLRALKFNTRFDRVFSVGDLVDRGANSPAALQWFDQPWFHPVLGNHEDMLLQSFNDEKMLRLMLDNGGEWWLQADQKMRYQFQRALYKLPVVIEIETQNGVVGIVHADVPSRMNWGSFVSRLKTGDKKVREIALWSRIRSTSILSKSIDGITKVYCGHTIVDEPKMIKNMHFMDTGAYKKNGKLSILAINK